MQTAPDINSEPVSSKCKLVAYMVMVALLNMVSLPAQAAFQYERERQNNLKSAVIEDAYTQLLNDLAQYEMVEAVSVNAKNNSAFAHLSRSFKSLFAAQKTPAQLRLDKAVQNVLQLKINIENQHQQWLDGLPDQPIAAKKLEQINAHFAILQNLFLELEKSQEDSQKQQALFNLHAQLKKWQPPVAKMDMQNLPWGNARHDLPVPFEAIGTRANDTLEDDHNPVWTASNIEVKINSSIRKLAQELEHNPAKIYKWVYDNITFIPSYGSIQGSELTLQTKRGNSFDTASLLIALLRASNIPARYVHGSIEVPTAQVLDWVGGVANASAAQNLLAQGGVPVVGIKSGSQITKVRMNHIWVEAFVPMLVHRGSKPVEKTTGQSRSWIPLDASFKTYTRTNGIDLAKAVPFDAQKLIDDVKQGAKLDETIGSVQNLNQQAIEQTMAAYQKKITQYLADNHPNTSAAEIIGTQKINPYPSQMLSFNLPYQVHATTARYHTLPDYLRHYFVLKMYADGHGAGAPIIDIKLPTAKLQGKPLALSFNPASQSEEQKLLDLLPQPNADGTGIQPEQLPKTLPANIALIPEITLGNTVLATAGRFNLGDDIKMRMGFESPNSVYPSTINKQITAGEYHAIGYNLQGMSQQQLQQTITTLEHAKTSFEQYAKTKNSAVVDGLTKHDVVGAMLQATIQSYFAITQTQSEIAQRQAKVVEYPYMSFGTFSTNLMAVERYGIPFKVKAQGLMMDIDRYLNQTVAKDNDHKTFVAYNQASGMRMSANEHLIPEQMFDNPNTPEKEADAVSAVKALQIAAQQGQTIYTVNSNNQSDVLPKLKNHSASILQDIRNALYANKTIIISEQPIQFKNWQGAGYIILDNDTGAGAYLIESGVDGGFLDYYLLIQMYMCNFKQFLGVLAGLSERYMKKLESISGLVVLASLLKDVFSVVTTCKESENFQRIVISYVLAVIAVVAISGAVTAIPGVGMAFFSLLFLPDIGGAILDKFKDVITSEC